MFPSGRERDCVSHIRGADAGNGCPPVGDGGDGKDERVENVEAVVVYDGDASELTEFVGGRGAAPDHFAVEGEVFAEGGGAVEYGGDCEGEGSGGGGGFRGGGEGGFCGGCRRWWLEFYVYPICAGEVLRGEVIVFSKRSQCRRS